MNNDRPNLGARGFFLVGGDRIERLSREGESRSGEKKTSGTNGLTTSLPCGRQFLLIDIRSHNGPLIIQRMEFGTETKIKLAFWIISALKASKWPQITLCIFTNVLISISERFCPKFEQINIPP